MRAGAFLLCISLIVLTALGLPIDARRNWGYIDKRGKTIIEPQFNEASSFSEGLAAVTTELGSKWGYIDKTGKMVIKQQFVRAKEFSEGLAEVSYEGSHGGLWGYVDRTGRMAIEPQFDNSFPFSEGLAGVAVGGKRDRGGHRIGGKWGFVDKNGQMVIEPRFDFVWPFSQGLAYARAQAKDKEKWGKCGYIDKSGKWAIKPRFAAGSSFSEGLAVVTMRVEGLGYRWGYIDKTGKMVIDLQFKEGAMSFSEGLAAVSIDGKKWGYIDKSGKMVIKPQFDYAQAFCGGLAAVHIRGRYGFIDETGELAIQPRLGLYVVPDPDPRKQFSEGLTVVYLKGAPFRFGEGGLRYGYIDKTGNRAIAQEFEAALNFSEGLAAVKVVEK